ncbi:hypothetical protein OHB26_20870 [Nocardia sp. NBC_01503]|uniref:hypothetical protein n=1 Tax=Nocardia sp. NBC_01503 TaxID=2975997 RepID=UPI002E7B1B28|nr:hypothetical protein [Nocardia sp. NBC_01503]WTL29454.1 hypothetical protein OHB26_20870 [Nocardia sp. NBC_01503]
MPESPSTCGAAHIAIAVRASAGHSFMPPTSMLGAATAVAYQESARREPWQGAAEARLFR